MISDIVLIVIYILVLIYSAIIHEVSHGIAALWLGDSTAKYAGRLSANPLKHIDPNMTIFVPLFMLLLSGGRFAFGGAKPVPYNPYNLKYQKWGPTLVALAGPLSNILIAFIAAIVARLLLISLMTKEDIISIFYRILSGTGSFFDNIDKLVSVFPGSLGNIFFSFMIIIIIWNVILAFFNLIPIPPLDGSKLLYSIFNIKLETMAILEQYGFFVIIFLIIFFPMFIGIYLGTMLHLFFGIAV